MEQRGEDEALIARVARGDRAAFEQLYRRNGAWITARLQSRCADVDLVDIAVQDTFVVVWSSAHKYKGTGDVGAWMWGIAIRKLVDQLRKRRPLPLPPEAVVPVAVSFEEDLLASGPYSGVADALRQLEPDLQVVVLATAVDGLSTREAARLLGIPQGTVKTRLMRARRQLQDSAHEVMGERR